MAVLLSGVALFALSFFVQAGLWRIAVPRRPVLALILLYAVVPFIVIVVVRSAFGPVEISIAALTLVALSYVSFSLAYIVFYSTLEQQSPTLAIVSYVARAGCEGCSDEQLFRKFGQGMQLTQRLSVMEQTGWVRCEGELVTLTRNGLFYAHLFESAARIFGLSKGG